MTDSQLPTKRYSNFFLIRLIKGDISLAITFWLFLTLGNFLFKLLGILITANAVQIELSGHGYVFSLYNCIYFPYIIIIWIAVWNSANEYKGAWWGTLAQIVVILGILYTVAINISGESTVTLENELSEINKSLPRMLDSDTEISSVTADNEGLYYNYRLVNSMFSDMDVPSFTNTARERLKIHVCSDESSIDNMDNFGKIHFVYSDQNSVKLSDIVFTKNDCL